MSRRSVQLYGDQPGGRPGVSNVCTVNRKGQIQIAQGDSAVLDAFGRLRVSNPFTLLDSIQKYDKQSDLWNEAIAGGGTSVHSFDAASTLMTVSASGDRVTRQTREYYRYQPGKSQLILATFVLDAAGSTTNVNRCLGYFDDDNGVFLALTDNGLELVLRSNATGTPVDTVVPQISWNQDKYIEFDTTKTQILVIDLQWLGSGRVRVGFVINGVIEYVHEFDNDNTISSVYMTTAQLPMRYEIVATGVPDEATSMRHICCTVVSEGGAELFHGVPHAASSGAPAAVSGTLIPILSIRPKALFKTEVNRVQALQRALQVVNTGSGTAEVHVIYDGALTSASFASVNAESTMEVDTDATAITGGRNIHEFYVPASNVTSGEVLTALIGRLTMSLDIAGANPTNLTVAITNHGTVTAAAAMTWQEYQ